MKMLWLEIGSEAVDIPKEARLRVGRIPSQAFRPMKKSLFRFGSVLLGDTSLSQLQIFVPHEDPLLA